MKDKIWTEYKLKKRDEVAAFAARLIANSKNPRDMVEIHMPELLKYEILPNIIWDGKSDDEIREFAKSKISPPRRLSQAPDFNHHNKKPLIPVSGCLMLAIDVEIGTPIRTKAEEDKHRRILDLALSYGHAKRQPFADWRVGSFDKYLIEPIKFKEWLELVGEEPPPEWDPAVQSVPEDWQPADQVSLQRAKKSGALDVSPTWILRQIPGGQWECGDESAPVRIKNLLGLADMAYAIKLAEKEINPFDLPGSGSGLTEITNLKRRLSENPDSSIKETQGLHFGSDDISDPEAMQQYKAKGKSLLDEIEVAETTGNESEQAAKTAELTELRMHIAGMTFPGNRNKKLDTGNPVIKATHAARERKSTAIGKLKEASLPDMAAHLDKSYDVQQKIIIYTPAALFPKWILK